MEADGGEGDSQRVVRQAPVITEKAYRFPTCTSFSLAISVANRQYYPLSPGIRAGG
jgi:hypothetical protein